jgi:AraC-like DNA-binding protein
MTKQGEYADRASHFSTDSVPARDRLPYFREAFGRSTARVELAPVEGCPLGWSASFYSFDGLGVISGQTNGVTCRRTQQLLTDGNDDFLFTANLSGASLAFQVGRECRLGPGDAVLKSCSDVGGHDFPGPAQYLTLRIPRRRLNGMAVKPEDALARRIPASTETLRLLVDYVKTTLRNHPMTSPQLRRLFTTHVHDLVALAVGATRDVSDVAHRRGLQVARLNAIKGAIITGLGSEHLNIAGIARGCGVTPRYVQMLFESERTTFTEYVLEQRLARAHRMLTDPAFSHWTISAIAFEVGFENMSYFNRVFRRNFAGTPSDMRAAAQTAAS